jgi:hypothetical protein
MPRPQFIDPPKAWRARATEAASSIDADAIARAEAALAALSGQFDGWMEAELARMDEARRGARADAWSEPALRELSLCAHDAKGLGATYNYPLVTRIAGSLGRLLETTETRTLAAAAPSIIEAHVDGARAIVRQQIRTSDDATGGALAAALEAHVVALIGLPQP